MWRQMDSLVRPCPKQNKIWKQRRLPKKIPGLIIKQIGKKLKTDDQAILRTANVTQEMEIKAFQRMEEFLGGEYSGHGFFWSNPKSEYYKARIREKSYEALVV